MAWWAAVAAALATDGLPADAIERVAGTDVDDADRTALRFDYARSRAIDDALGGGPPPPSRAYPAFNRERRKRHVRLFNERYGTDIVVHK